MPETAVGIIRINLFEQFHLMSVRIASQIRTSRKGRKIPMMNFTQFLKAVDQAAAAMSKEQLAEFISDSALAQ